MKKLKLLKINKRDLNSPELAGIKGGLKCTDYKCSCSPGTQEWAYVDVYLDTSADAGYLP